MAKSQHFRFDLLADKDPTFRVFVVEDGHAKPVGTVRDFYIRHMNRRGWESVGKDGHRAVHEHRWQAALALTWDGTGYPFPYAASREREVIAV